MGTLWQFVVTCPHCEEQHRVTQEGAGLPTLVSIPCGGLDLYTADGCSRTSHYYLDETGAQVLTDAEYRAMAPLQRNVMLGA